MKKLVLLFFSVSIGLTACKKTATPETVETTTLEEATEATQTAAVEVTPTDSVNVGKFEFKNSNYNYGTVEEGTIVKHSFKFKNVGTVPLVISDAKASCGCTIPSPPKDPIPVGGEEEILVEFNTSGKTAPGAGKKVIRITANTFPPVTMIEVDGTVIPKAK